VNFFGHAAIAVRLGGDPAFVLGSMLPDLSNMVGCRTPAVHGASIQAGVACHHRADEVFHASSSFRRLSASAFEELTRRGVARGPARAVAHVGVELLFDPALARLVPDTAERCRAAFAHARSRDRPGIDWPTRANATRFSEVCGALALRVQSGNVTAQLVTERLERILRARPRLAIPAAMLAAVTSWAEGARAPVAGRARFLLEEVLAALRADRP
jgi:hypothetical protein